MTDRDHFAAAALAGLLANGDYGMESAPGLAWGMADAMLRERERLHNDASAYTGGISAASGSKLTDAEREAITVAAGDSSQWGRPHARVLLRLLERTK